MGFTYGGRQWHQSAAILQCTEIDLTDAFVVLVADIAERIASLPAGVTWPAIVQLVEEWQDLLGRRTQLSSEQQLGMWAELWVISNAAEVDLLIESWRGPDQEASDFFLGGRGLEVKASKRAHVHFVSQSQVETPVGAHDSYLMSVWIGIDPARGTSLPELVDSLLRRTTDPPRFLKKLSGLGYSLADREQYGTKWQPLDVPLWFRTQDVPRIRAMDSGISHVRYLATLDPDKSLPPGAAIELWRHFCATVPDMVSAADTTQ